MCSLLQRPSRGVRALLGLGACIIAAIPARAQDAVPSGESACFGFAFGAWTPALDWRAAGHPPRAASVAADSAPYNRQWAVNGAPGDSLIVLFPSWWPAGVMVKLRRTPTVRGDTVSGQAVALVADGRLKPPTSSARVWAVSCGGRR